MRLPTSKFMGALKGFRAQLGAMVVRRGRQRAGVDPGRVDEIIMGNVLPRAWQAPARQAA